MATVNLADFLERVAKVQTTAKLHMVGGASFKQQRDLRPGVLVGRPRLHAVFTLPDGVCDTRELVGAFNPVVRIGIGAAVQQQLRRFQHRVVGSSPSGTV